MKFKIKQEILIEHLNYVIKGISNKNIRPILNCIKFDLTDEGLALLSTDNEISIKSFIDKKQIENIDTTGQIVIAGRYIYDIVRKLPDEIISFEETIDSKIFITTNSSTFTLNCNNPEEFPDLELEYQKQPIILNNLTFKNIINQTAFATSSGESRPVLTGINIKIEEDILECTATDSYRLALKKVKLDQKIENNINIIIPTKNILELLKILKDDDIQIHIFNNKIIFKFDTITMMSRLISGTYPDTSNLIPKEYNISFKVNYQELFGAIDRASLLTTEGDKNIIKLETNGKEAIISSNIPEIGNVEEKIEIETESQEKLKISFNAKFMLEAIRAMETEKLKLEFTSDIKPIILKNDDSDDTIQLILPIRTY